MRHLIRRQVLEIQFPDKEDPQAFQERLGRLHHVHLIATMQKVLDEWSAPNQIDRIASLEIDMGVFPISRLEHFFEENFEEIFRKALVEKIGRPAGSDKSNGNRHATSSEVPHISDLSLQQSTKSKAGKQELLIHYMENGLFPWWAEVNDNRMLEECVEEWLASSPQSLMAYVSRWLRLPLIRQRLIHSLSNEALEKIWQLMVELQANTIQRNQHTLSEKVPENATARFDFWRKNFDDPGFTKIKQQADKQETEVSKKIQKPQFPFQVEAMQASATSSLSLEKKQVKKAEVSAKQTTETSRDFSEEKSIPEKQGPEAISSTDQAHQHQRESVKPKISFDNFEERTEAETTLDNIGKSTEKDAPPQLDTESSTSAKQSQKSFDPEKSVETAESEPAESKISSNDFEESTEAETTLENIEKSRAKDAASQLDAESSTSAKQSQKSFDPDKSEKPAETDEFSTKVSLPDSAMDHVSPSESESVESKKSSPNPLPQHEAESGEFKKSFTPPEERKGKRSDHILSKKKAKQAQQDSTGDLSNQHEEDVSESSAIRSRQQIERELRLQQQYMQRSPFSQTKEIYLFNSGLILLWPYYEFVFTELGWVKEKAFVNWQAQHRAAQFLHGLTTGQAETPEQLMALNKLLCNIPIQAPLEPLDPLTEDDLESCESLLKGVIAQVPALGEISPDGFRGTFILRDGVLKPDGDRWQLNVQKEAFDVLLEKFPWPYSFIKLPWMEFVLHVDW